MNKKKLLSIALSIAFIMPLAACSKSNATSKGQKQVIIWNAGIQTSDPSGKIKKEDMPVYKLIKNFEAQNPGAKVTIVDYDMDKLNQAFTAAVMAKKGPDLVAVWAGSSTFAYQNYLVDYNKYLSADEKKQYDVSSLLHKDNNSSEALIGLTFGMPSTPVMYYNTKIFKDNNLSVPTTWDELVTVSKTLKSKGITPMVIGDKDGYTSTWAVSSMLANELGPDKIAQMAPKGNVSMQGPEFTTALKTWKSYVDAGYTNPDYITMSDGDAIQAFVQGKGAMLIHGNWSATSYEAMGDNVGLTRIPALAGTQYADYTVSQPNINLIIPSYSPNQDIAVKFVKQLVSPEFNKESNAALYSQPVSTRLTNTADQLAAAGKNVTGFDSIIKGDAANQFYKLVPTYLKGNLKLNDFTKNLVDLNK